MILTERRIQRYECASKMDNDGNADTDIDNDDYAEDDSIEINSIEEINDVDAVNNDMNTDGNIDVDIDTDNGNKIDDIKDEDYNVKDDNVDEAQSFISKGKVTSIHFIKHFQSKSRRSL